MIQILPGIVPHFFDQRYPRVIPCAKKICSIVIKPFAHIDSFFIATARGTTHACFYLKHRLNKAIQIVGIRVWIVFIRTCPGTPDTLGSLSFNQLDNYRKTKNFTRDVVDTFIADCCNKLINNCRNHPDMLTVLRLPNQATLDREKAWDQVMELLDQLSTLTAFVKDTPLSIVLSMQFIRSSIERADRATLVLRDALLPTCSDQQPTPLDALRPMTKASEIRDWLRSNPNALANVTVITLSHLNPEVIPSEIRFFPNLVTLTTRTHQPLIIPDKAFEGLDFLQTLDLSYNTLTQLPPHCFSKLGSLRNLYLRDANITQLPKGVFEMLHSLNSLDISYNKITNIDQVGLQELSSLQWLDISHNKIKDVDHVVWEKFPQLKGLEISHTEIPRLPQDLFHKAPNLSWLYRNGTQLQKDFFHLGGLNRRCTVK
jgi:Leucine-rich repeat (LRR) protein